MKFGVNLAGLVQQPVDEDLARRSDEVIDWAHAIRDAGYDGLIIGEHYLTSPYQQLQPVPVLARLIPETGDMLLACTLVAPLHNPVELAATWATLDVMSGGRIALSLALGYRDVEYAAFGVDPRKRVTAMRDVVETVRALWTQDEVTARGRNFDLDGATSTIRPLQQPHPPIWIAANADAAVQRAARWGLRWNINAHAAMPTIRRQVALYRETAEEAGFSGPFRFTMSRELYCGATRDEAFRLAGPYVAGKYDAYDQWGQDEALPDDEDFAVPFAQLAEGRFILGDPDDCEAWIRELEELGVDHLNMRMNWPGMPLDLAMAGMQRFAAEVLPRFR